MSELLKNIEKNLTKQELKEQIAREAKLPYKTVYAEKIGESKEAIDKLVEDSLKSVKTELNKVESVFSAKLTDIENVINPKIIDMNHDQLYQEYFLNGKWNVGEIDIKIKPEKGPAIGYGPSISEDNAKLLINKAVETKNKTAIEFFRSKPAMKKIVDEIITPNVIIGKILNDKVGEIKAIIKDVKSLDAGAIETKKKVIKAIDELQSNITTKMQALRTDVQGDVMQAKEFIYNVKEWISELFKPQNLIFIMATIGTLTATITAISSGSRTDKVDVLKLPKL